MSNPKPEDPELKRLFKSAAVKRGGADFWIIDNTGAADRDLIAQVSGVFDKTSGTSTTLDLSSVAEVSDLLDRLKDIKAQGYDLVHVTGGDRWLTQRQSFNDGTADAAAILNIARENLFKVKVIMAFYLSEKGIAHLANEAPDLWSWRGGIYKLQDNAPSAPKSGLTP
jgi:hypothetical protein